MPDAADQCFAPPQAHVADLESDAIVLAGRGTRLMAAIVDARISAVIVWAVRRIPTPGQGHLAAIKNRASSTVDKFYSLAF